MTVVVRWPGSALPPATAESWRADVLARLRGGARLVTLFGRRLGDQVLLTAVLQHPDGALHVARALALADTGYRALTAEHAAAHCFERELVEQTGLPLTDHPWPKPLRYQDRDQAAMADHPFWQLQGKEVHEVAVGPIHAGVIEPGSFRFSCLGEQVHHLEIQLGYQHRGVEARLLAGDPRRHTPLVETIAGDTSVAHAWAFGAALEALADVAVPAAAVAARGVALELERIAMHLAGLSGLATDIAFLQGASSWGRLRTTAINTSMRLCGSRFGRGAVRPGGVRMALTAELRAEVAANLRLLQHDCAHVDDLFFGARSATHRLRGIGTLRPDVAAEIGVVGMAARASGLALDARTAAGGIWHEVPIASVVHADGDCLARARIRADEIRASLAWLSQVLERHPEWPAPPPPLPSLAPGQFVVAIVEGWRGEVVHCLETDERGRLTHAKVQDPSLRNWLGLAVAMRGNEISDFPICNKSFDLSYCGHDL
ncbi:MAG: hydrogenase [Planctomycetes bacterium]|nr:hydrogenase [Planctomycetota bacterium]